MTFCCICSGITRFLYYGEEPVRYVQYIQVALLSNAIICHESDNAKLVVCIVIIVIILVY